MSYRRFVALGDSLTEGKGDAYPNGELRGFADMVAHGLRATVPDVVYANLARPSVRAHEIRRDQAPQAAAMAPDLVTAVAGINDVIALAFPRRRVHDEGGPQILGYRLPPALQRSIAAIDLAELPVAPADRVLLMQNSTGSHLDGLHQRLSPLSESVQHERLPADCPWMGEFGAAIALPPVHVLRPIADWLAEVRS